MTRKDFVLNVLDKDQGFKHFNKGIMMQIGKKGGMMQIGEIEIAFCDREVEMFYLGYMYRARQI